MGTASSLEVAVRGLRARGFPVAQLGPWPDVETEDDLAGLMDSDRAEEDAPRTARWLGGRRSQSPVSSTTWS